MQKILFLNTLSNKNDVKLVKMENLKLKKNQKVEFIFDNPNFIGIDTP